MSAIILPDTFPRLYRPSIKQLCEQGEDAPFVITGVVPEWPGFTKWTTEYLKQKYGELTIRVRDKRKGVYTSRKDVLTNPGEEMSFTNYIENIIESDDPTTANLYMFERNPKDFPGLEDDFSVPESIEDKCIYPGFWVSCKGASTRLHYDQGHNFLAQVKGQKKLILFQPNLANLYPYSRSGVSQVDVENPDYNKFPNFRAAQPLECNLKAGEILFLPSCWWHQVYSVDRFNISINFFWKPPLSYTLAHLPQLLRPHLIRCYESMEKFIELMKLR